MSAQLDLIPICRIPERGTQCYELLRAMQSGARLTVAKALTQHGVYALSQRMGDLRDDYGWPIKSRFVGKFKEYWLETSSEGR